MNFRARSLLIILVAAVWVGCGTTPARQEVADGEGQTAAGLTQAQAQSAVDEWISSDAGPSRDGSAVVVAVRDKGDMTYATAELRLKNFTDIDGHVSPSEDPGEAIFAHQNNGSWVLSSVVWDFGRRTASPNVTVH